MQPHEITALRQVTRARLAASEARLAALRQREEEIVARLTALAEAFRRRATEARADDLTLRAGIDLRWEAWVEERRRALLTAQAQLRVVIEQERATLRHDFGRDMALAELAREGLHNASRLAARRSERDALG